MQVAKTFVSKGKTEGQWGCDSLSYEGKSWHSKVGMSPRATFLVPPCASVSRGIIVT
jgi:hypothetical protein